MTDPVSGTFTSQRLTLSTAAWGNPDDPLVILVHGGLDQKRSWDWTARHLAKRFYVVAYDLRGHGQSDHVSDGDYGVMDHVYDLASLVNHLGRDTFRIVSHSLGGNIAVRYAGLFPEQVEALVAIEGLGPSPKMLAERKAEAADDRMRNWIEQRRKFSDRVPRVMESLEVAEGRMRAAHKQLSEEQVKHLTLHGVAENQDGTYRWAYDAAAMGRSPSDIPNEVFELLWSKITCPSLLIYGADSWASDPIKDGRAAKWGENAEVKTYANAGHWVHHDQLDTFLADLDRVL